MEQSVSEPIERAGPGAACSSCRKMKMRCIRLHEAACQRCQKARRPCLPARAADRRREAPTRKLLSPHRRGTEWSKASLMSPPATLNSPLSSTKTSNPPILASIYTTSPYAEAEKIRRENTEKSRHQSHHADLNIIDSLLETTSAEQDAEVAISPEHTGQLIMIFREKLIKAVAILDPNDFIDVDRLMAHHPDLVTCVSYVTTRYIPGYQKYRERTKSIIINFLQASFDYQQQSDAEQIRTMEALMILYAFAPSTISTPSFAFVRAACEAYATKIGLHRAVDPVKQLVANGTELSKNDLKVKRYLYWIWLYVISHHRSLVRKIPPTIPTDDSILNAPALLETLGQDKYVGRLISELHSRLIWDDIGRKGRAMTEWWLERHIIASAHAANPVTIGEIDAAVAHRRDQLLLLQPRKLGSTADGMAIEYHFRLAHFCLSTHLILRITASNIGPSDLHIIQRCVHLAIDVLHLTRFLGPIGREAFRFQPGFVFVSLTFCMSFVLQALQAFPDQFHEMQSMLKVIRKISSMMTDCAVDQTHDCGAAGRAILRQLRITVEILRNRHLQEQEKAKVASEARDVSAASNVHGEVSHQNLVPTPPPLQAALNSSSGASHERDPRLEDTMGQQQENQWAGATMTNEHGFPSTFMENIHSFDYEQLVLDPAFNLPDFFGSGSGGYAGV